MASRKVDDVYILRLDKGQEILPSIKDFCEANNITAGIISGLGVAEDAKLGCFNLNKKEYETKVFKGDYEITSLTGNVSSLNNEIFIHLHINLADASFNIVGGHLLAGKIGLTGEIFIQSINTKIDRIRNEDLGLNVMDL